MGAAHSQRSGAVTFSLSAIAKETHFSRKELMTLLSAFMKAAGETPEAGKSVITREQFDKVLKTSGTVANNHAFLKLLFDAFDKNGQGTVNFVEYCTGLSVVMRGDPEEKYQLCFEIYDTGRTGEITKAEMRSVFEAMNVTMKHANEHSVSHDTETLDGFVNEIYAKCARHAPNAESAPGRVAPCPLGAAHTARATSDARRPRRRYDKEHNDRLTFGEFLKACKAHPEIVEF